MEEKLGESNKRWELFESYSRQIPPPKKSLLSALLFALGVRLSDILQRLFFYLFIFFFRSIPYTAIQSATSQRRMFHLVYLSLDGEETSLNFKLDSSQSASGLYRAITEKHAFYSCETVRSAVTAQFIRDLKVRTMLYCYLLLKGIDLIACSSSQGTIISIFNEDSTLGKKYVFDIRRTCREVYDNARRALYCEAATVTLPEEKEILEKHDCGDCEEPKCKVSTRGGKGGKRKGNNFF